MAADPLSEARNFVGTLAAMQESEKILASNRQAAQEALASVKRAREEAARVKDETDKLKSDAQAQWRATAAEIEDMKQQVVAMKAAAETEYQAHVRRALDEIVTKRAALQDEIKQLVFDKGEKLLEIRRIDEDVAIRRKALDDVRREMAALAERLKT